MGQRDRRWVGWSITALLLLFSLLTAGFLTFWFVVWPFHPWFVLMHSPWTIPFVRASAFLTTIGDEGRQRFHHFVNIDPSGVQSDLVACLQGDDQAVRRAALELVYLVAEQTVLEPSLCAEIVRATTEVHQSDVRWTALQNVQFLPDAEPRLISMFETGDRDLQFAAVISMTRMGNRTLTKRILPLLEDSQMEVRRWALQLLSYTRDPEATSTVTPFLQDPDQDSRMWASRFLRDVNQPFEKE